MEDNLIVSIPEENKTIIDLKNDTKNVPKRIKVEYELTKNIENISEEIKDREEKN